ncbi:MAG: hypothetical protein AABZ44_01840, partial [Elusimicrobiota bacterium]
NTVSYTISLASDKNTSQRLVTEALALAGGAATSNARKGATAECVITEDGKVVSDKSDVACALKYRGSKADITCKAVHETVCRIPVRR